MLASRSSIAIRRGPDLSGVVRRKQGRSVIAVDVVEDFSSLRELQPVWNSFLSRSCNKSVFLTWEWIETWWQAYGFNFNLLVLVAHDRGAVCGIAPLVVRRGSSARLELFGQNKAYGEYLDFIVPRDLERDVIPALCRRIILLGALGKWRGVHFATVLVDSPNLALIEEEFAKGGVALQRVSARVCPFVELPAAWEEYLMLKGKDFSRRVLYNERRLARSGKVTLELPRDESEIDGFFDELVELHSRRWNQEVDAKFFTFHRHIAHLFFGLNQLLLCRLRVGQRVVAAKYDFLFDNKVWGYQGGWLPEFKDREVGSVLLCEIFKWSVGQKYREYDFLEGDAWYKRRWSTAHRSAFDLVHGSQLTAYVFDEPDGVPIK
jgi:CelD/BcsL family acetyltransferase involved in cellulose biosynthesis